MCVGGEEVTVSREMVLLFVAVGAELLLHRDVFAKPICFGGMVWPAELRAWPVLAAVLGVAATSFIGAGGNVALVLLVLLAALSKDWFWRLSAAICFFASLAQP